MPFVQLKDRDPENGQRMRTFRVGGENYVAGEYVEVPEGILDYFRNVKTVTMLPPSSVVLPPGKKPKRPYRPAPAAFNIFETEEDKEAHRLKMLTANGAEPSLDYATLRRELQDTKALVENQTRTIHKFESMIERLVTAAEAKVAASADDADALDAAEMEHHAPGLEAEPEAAVEVSEADDEPSYVITTSKLQGRRRRR